MRGIGSVGCIRRVEGTKSQVLLGRQLSLQWTCDGQEWVTSEAVHHSLTVPEPAEPKGH